MPPLSPRTWPVWPLIGVGLLLARLPWRLQRALGAALGRLLSALLRRRRAIAAGNLALCFPELTDAERAALLRRHFRALGIGAFAFLRAWWGSLEPVRRASRIEGLEVLERLRAEGRGVLLLGGHFLSLEICGRLLAERVPLAGMYRPHRNPAMEWAVRRGRLRYARAMFDHEQLRAAVRHLRAGGILWYAPDQAYRRGKHLEAPFFGVAVPTLTASHDLARMTGAAVVPFFHRPEGAGYRIRIGEPLPSFPGEDRHADVARVNAVIEAMVRESPAEYLWIHDRFKRRRAG
ncbi:MAG: LpxL/LpxP family Kdo(2)-lipid IV(A) lauroyl/palmitoleoyl acyltransferase [Xanthomonadales bacterium]|nr:LpxL/LpxP family Kdo(2)-lipid IV(A) lauroyl/palmitoleoyl acyltransferase [Xanthomonadales bacterium]